MTNPKPGKGITIALWTAQVLLFLLFAGTGVWKLITPISALAAKFPWMGEVSPAFLRLTPSSISSAASASSSPPSPA